MKKIACVGYHATGAGVIDDLLREFDNVAQGKYESEVKLLHEPDGVSDLEFHLVNNPTRLGSSIAIKRFVKMAERSRRQFENVFGSSWMDYVNDYIQSLTVIKYKGYGSGDVAMLSDWELFKLQNRRRFNSYMPKPFRKPIWHNYLPNMETIYSKLEIDVFLNITRQFIEKLCEAGNTQGKEYFVLDQFAEASNPMRYARYTDNLKIIIVDRDPRDVYIHNMYKKDRRLPKKPEEFCTHYRMIRERARDIDPNVVMYINFEDMIYNYDISVKKVLDFLNISKEHHVNPRSHFNPDISINGTQMWLSSHTEYSQAVKIIEQQLPDMLYNFPK